MFEKLIGPKNSFKDALLILEQGLRNGEITLDGAADADRTPQAVELYVPLLNEGTEVLRPTKGLPLGPNIVQAAPEIGLSTKTVELYVPLLNEGTDVLRPTKGLVVEPGIVQVLATSDYDPSLEEWEFPPGSKVALASEVRGGRKLFVARQRVNS